MVVARLPGENNPYKKEKKKRWWGGEGGISPPVPFSPLKRESGGGGESTDSWNVGISSVNTGPRTFK